MRTDVVRMYKDIHSWVGIFSGLALFIAFYAGAVTMFEMPLQRWASPPPAPGAAPALAQADALIAQTIAAHPGAAKAFTIYVDITPESPARLSWSTGGRRDPGVTHQAGLGPEGELAVSSQGPSPVAEFVDVLHQQIGLPLPHEPAMLIMGAVCLLYAIALVSGTIVLIPSLIKDMFLVRLGKNAKRMWLDAHNALGLFSLPFHIIMALSSVVFAFHDQFYDAQALAFKAETSEERAAAAAPPANAAPRPLLAPQAVVAALARQAPDFEPKRLNYARQPNGGYALRVEGADPAHMLRGADFGVALVDPYSGRITGEDYMPGRQSGWFAAVSSFFALHFGNFGGAPVRWMYFALGLAGALLFYTGNLLWVESRRKRERKAGAVEQTRATRILGALTVGVTLGCVAGLSLTIAAAKWAGPGATPALHSAVYYTAFCLAVAWALARGAARAGSELLWCAAAATLAIPLTSAVSPWLAQGWNHGGATLLVDGVAACGAALFALAAQRARRRGLDGVRDSIWSLTPAPQ